MFEIMMMILLLGFEKDLEKMQCFIVLVVMMILQLELDNILIVVVVSYFFSGAIYRV